MTPLVSICIPTYNGAKHCIVSEHEKLRGVSIVSGRDIKICQLCDYRPVIAYPRIER